MRVGIITFLILLFMLPFNAYAESADKVTSANSTESAMNFGQNDVYDLLPDDAKSILDQQGITPNGGVLELTPQSVFEQIWNMVTKEIAKPLKLLFSVVGVILLCSLTNSIGEGAGGGQANTTFSLVAVLAGAAMIIGYITDVLTASTTAINGGNTFMAGFIPAFAGMVGISGRVSTATVFNGLIIGCGELFSQLSAMFLMPLSTCILGISLAGAVNPELKLQRLGDTIKKIVVWGLGLLMTVFVGVLGLQSFVANSADTVALKTARFTISNAVPFVGGAISDALGTMQGSIGIIKNSFGTFGIIAGAMTVLPTIITAACYKLALLVAGAISDMFGLSRLSEIIRSGENVLSIILAMLVCFMLIVTVSVSLMLFIGMNSGL